MFAAAAATGILSLSGTPALADSIAVGATDDASGLLSGNNVQAPIDVPVNVCGNTVGVLAAFNDAYGNTCGNVSHAGRSGSAAGARAEGRTEDASGIASGNNIQAPVHAPVNVCGNTVNVLAALNDTYGNACAETVEWSPPGYGTEDETPPASQTVAPPSEPVRTIPHANETSPGTAIPASHLPGGERKPV